MPIQLATEPDALSVPVLGLAPYTKGRFTGRLSRGSKNGAGSRARSSRSGIWRSDRSSWLSLLMVAHRLEWLGASHSIV